MSAQHESAERPAYVYYRACVGAWAAPVEFEILDPAALRSSGMGALDRLRLHLLSRWPRWLGRLVMHTTVSFVAEDTVEHTTAFRWMGIALERSREEIVIDADGRTFRLQGDVSGEGRVDEMAVHARYAIAWFGVTLTQHTTRGEDTVTLTQSGPGFRSVQHLVRRR